MTTVTGVAAVVLAGVLLYSGSAKALATDDLSGALAELLSSTGSYRWLARLVAIAELLASVLLALRPDAVLTRVVVGGLGVSFAVAGVAGRLRRTTRPCGCFGTATTGALGLWNAAIGLVFVLWAAVPAGRPVDRPLAIVA